MGSNRTGSDEGSVLLWVVGCAAVALLVVAALTQIVATTHQRRLLQYETDAAALIAANKVDVSQFRISGNLGDIELARAEARTVVNLRLSQAAFPIRIEELVFTSNNVMLRTSQAISSNVMWGLRPSQRVFAETSVALTQAP